MSCKMENMLLSTKYVQSSKFRFWSKVIKTNSCWLWKGTKLLTGYGQFQYGDKTIRVHRLIYFWKFGRDIMEGKDLHHTCENKLCVNPDHLQPMTRKEHNLLKKGKILKHFCSKGHSYDMRDSAGNRRCRRCYNEGNRNWHHNKKDTKRGKRNED